MLPHLAVVVAAVMRRIGEWAQRSLAAAVAVVAAVAAGGHTCDRVSVVVCARVCDGRLFRRASHERNNDAHIQHRSKSARRMMIAYRVAEGAEP